MGDLNKKDIYLIEYEDAAFSYEPEFSDKFKKIKMVRSIGWIRKKNDNHLDLGLIRSIKDNKIKYQKGLLIPIKAIKKMVKLYVK